MAEQTHDERVISCQKPFVRVQIYKRKSQVLSLWMESHVRGVQITLQLHYIKWRATFIFYVVSVSAEAIFWHINWIKFGVSID